eukprot:TRINITY_DN3337_c0_g4_i1.p1 TRINITY_DN3337_c0_g4~~TRINITY_DN3337_c0_g4_i1.p1  ORF type:complete len:396 (-),score=105.78 TRINITY_DN3337_c0_g4_i1:133-1290(-)
MGMPMILPLKNPHAKKGDLPAKLKEKDNPLKELLKNIRVENLLTDRELIYVNTDTSICDVLDVLKKNDLHAVPLRENLLKEDMGIISVMDIMSFLHKFWKEHQSNATDEEIEEFFNSEISRVAVHSLRDPLLTSTFHSNHQLSFNVEQSTSLFELTKQISNDISEIRMKKQETEEQEEKTKYSPYCKRVVIYASGGKVIENVISQTDILQFLYENIELIKTQLDNSNVTNRIAILIMLPLNNSLYIPKNFNAFSAFQFLYNNGISSAPIIDEDNNDKVIGHISISDCRGLDRDNFKDLFLPVLTFLENNNNNNNNDDDNQSNIIGIYSNTPLSSIIKILFEKRIHHLYVIDQDNKDSDQSFEINITDEKIIGIVSVSDLLCYLSS